MIICATPEPTPGTAPLSASFLWIQEDFQFHPSSGNMSTCDSVSVLLALGSSLAIRGDEIFWSGDSQKGMINIRMNSLD